MALDSNLESLFEKLKVEDPILPPSNWESIPSQNDAVWFSLHSSRKTSTPPDSLCDTFSVSEASLVRLALNALQGLESAIVSIEKLSAAFCSDPSDRTSHRIPSLWTRLSSTHALGNILRSIGCVGTLVFLLREFVEKYAYPNSDAYLTRSGLANGEGVISQSEHGIQKEEQPLYSLVNQAFAVAVRKVLEGYICALDTLYASVSLRRSSQHAYVPLHEARDKSCIRSVVNSEVTLLEVYLHSEELRTKIEALGNICNLYDIAFCFSRVSFEELKAKANLEVLRFYRGGNLLTYLYTQLKVSDPAQRPLLKFLFLRSCECYCGFIRSWILNAEVNDPYQEFILDIVEDLPHDHHFKVSALMQLPLARIRDGVAVPCFLKDILVPIIRSGQQLQVLKKLFELCKVGSGNHAYEGLLPGWSGGLSERLFNAFTMTFSKGSLEGMVTARNDYYKNMEQKLNDVLSKLEFSQHQRFGNGEANIYDDQRESLGTEVSFIVDDLFNTPPASDQQDSNVDLDNMISGSSSTTDESNLLDSAASDSDYSSLSYSEEQNESEQFEANNLIEQEGRYLSSLRFSCGNSICNLSQKFTKRTSKNIADNSGKKSEEPNLLSQIMPLGQGESNRLCTSDTQRKENVPSKSEMTSAINVFLEEPIGEELKNCTYVSNFLGLQPYSADFRLNFLSANPMFRISALLNQASNNGERCGKISQKSLPCFDFSTVEDPFKVSKEKSTASCLKTYVAGITDSIPIDKIHDKDKQSYDGGDMLACKTTGSSMYLPINTKQHGRDPVVSTKASGGSSWESLLDSNTNLNHNRCAIDHKQHLESMFEIPLDIVIDKCLVQEVLLQYKYVSKLAIKLLEEGFDLQEHLLALRRYFFMEVADWADLFIMSIWHHKWSVADADQRASEIQRFLKSSIQKSSCEQDFYKDQLFVYMKADDIIPLSPSAIGVRSFDFFGLGYHVNWPISIVVTPASLRIYAEIFSFLIQVKLAVFSLTDVWNSLKDLMQDIYQNQTKHKQVVGHCDMLVKLRHQVNHFVTTLQDYVLSQLAQVSWCRFIDSLKHKAKDMMDLESVHMEYLTDSLHICFLSNETRHIASIIEGMLQCALDFRSCLNGSSIGVGIHQGDSEKLSRINIAQVHKIKQMFHKNLIDLHLCYLKSPKHGEFGLSRFWGYLNYNEYYSDISDNIYTFRI